MLFRSTTRTFRHRYLLLWMVLGALTHVEAQQPAVPSQIGTAPLTADTTARSNTLQYGMNLSSAVDDNASEPGALSEGQTNVLFSVEPQGSLDIVRGRLNSRLFYAPGFTRSSTVSTYNNTSQAAGADLTYLLSKHVSLHVTNSFSLTTNPYLTESATNLPVSGILNQPNASAQQTDIRNRTELAAVDLVSQTSRHTSVGLGGSFSDLNYEPASTGTNGLSVKSRSWSAHGFYSHQLTARYNVGLQYTAQHFSSKEAEGQFFTLSHQVLGFLTISLTPAMQLSLFGGPDFSAIDNESFSFQSPIHTNTTSVTGGSTLSWQGQHNGLSVSFVQQVSDPGLNAGGSLLVRTIGLQAQRQLARQLSFRLFGNYTSNNRLDPFSTFSLADAAYAGIGLSRTLSPHFALSFSATRQQFLGSGSSGLQTYVQRSHDIFTVSLSYNFTRPIGR